MANELAVTSVADMGVMAEAIVKSGFYGFKTKEQVMAVMFVAASEGLHPATVCAEYDIIQNRPALKTQAMQARFQRAGGKVSWQEVGPKKCVGTFSHPDGGSLTVEWTMEMAKQAGLYRPGSGWEKYPEDMLRARCISRGVRSVYPACILGRYSVEEVQDFDDKPLKRPVKDMGPAVVVEAPTPAPEDSVALGPIEDMVDAVPIDAYNLHLPDGSIYAGFPTADEWVGGFTNMVYRVKASPKLADDAKKEKIMALRKANKHILDKLSATQKVAAMAGSKGIAVDEETGEIVA